MKISKSTLIEPLSAVNPSTYNPRTADPKRLDLIELSLRKLGFIAPIYADANGEILSGHQRHFVATRMGLKNVPVFRIPAMELQKRKALNIVFNRATNDGDICQTPEKSKRELETLNLSELAKNIQEKELDLQGVGSQTLQNKFWEVDSICKEHCKDSAQGGHYYADSLYSWRQSYKRHWAFGNARGT